MTARESPDGLLRWLGFVLVAGAFTLDFACDVRDRDLFSWMDPYQYYGFARGVLAGSERFNAFEIPSILPFFTMPFLLVEESVRAALWLNVASMLLLLFATHRLCRELDFETPAPVVAVLLLTSPLLLGLSRTLYIEFTLAAWMSLAFSLWLRFLKRRDLASGLAYGAVFAVAFMMKLTLPVFMVLPVAGAALSFAKRRDLSGVARVLAVGGLPIVAAISLHVTIFAPSLGYYINSASISLPFIRLMGPVDLATWESATFYPREVVETFLWLLTPLLLLHLWQARDRLRALRLDDLGGSRAAVWLWLLSPILLLTFHPLKEPRHVAVGVVPAVLLAVWAIEDLRSPRARSIVRAGAVAIACLQYVLVTQRVVETPYFMDRSLHYAEIRSAIELVDEDPSAADLPEPLRTFYENYGRNIALSGFEANEALALTWQGFPGVVFDLETFDDPSGHFEPSPYPSFEDLFFLAGINAYNRRCGWRSYQRTLERDDVVENADLVIVNEASRAEALERFPEHDYVATIERPSGEIQVLRARHPTLPYRDLHARRFLAQHPDLDRRERQVVARELMIGALLRGDLRGFAELRREFAELERNVGEVRNIYWIGGYPALIDLAAKRAARLGAR